MLKRLRIILPILVIFLAGFIFLSNNDVIMPFVILFTGAILLIAGIIEIKQKEHTFMGIFSIIISIFIIYSAIQF